MTEWLWLGDHVAVDFANTIVWPDENRREELLNTTTDLESWIAAEPAQLPSLGSLTPAEFSAIIDLRDHAVELLAAAVSGSNLPEESASAVNKAVRDSGTLRTLTSVSNNAAIESIAESPSLAFRGYLAAAVVDLIGREDLANLSRCAAPGCGQFFHRSRPNQRWCSPGCGNRARVDRHRHRRSPTPRSRS